MTLPHGFAAVLTNAHLRKLRSIYLHKIFRTIPQPWAE
jgi:hypothetical protein